MDATLLVLMQIDDKRWMADYFAAVPAILDEYGARLRSASRCIERVEGDQAVPDRIAIFSFPTMDHIRRFMADPRYLPFQASRMSGSRSQLFAFENAAPSTGLA